jgi:hypothetical protein
MMLLFFGLDAKELAQDLVWYIPPFKISWITLSYGLLKTKVTKEKISYS